MQFKQFSWQIAWDYPSFRLKFILGIVILAFILILIPHFFAYVENREKGYFLNDWLLAIIPAWDASIYIFLILYGMAIFYLYRMSRNTSICLTALWSYVFLCIARIITITIVPLLPPKDMIELIDPCSIIFYGGHTITKDLFFSGHTATIFLGALCLQKKSDKIIAFCATGVIGLLLLVQHVHYTADVFAAPFFSWIAWYFGKSIEKL